MFYAVHLSCACVCARARMCMHVWCGVMWCGVVWYGVLVHLSCACVRARACVYMCVCMYVWCGVVCCVVLWCGMNQQFLLGGIFVFYEVLAELETRLGVHRTEP